MPNISEHEVVAFRDELRKHAAGFADLVARAAPRLRAAGSLAGIGAAGGAAIGGGAGALSRYREAKEEGGSSGQAALSALGGALSGAGKGALIGTVAGAGAGALTGRGASLAARPGALGAPARFGQRQMHAATGMLQPHELESVGIHVGERAKNMGLTSVPGYLRSVKEHGLVPTLGASAREQMSNTPMALNALALGLPAAMAAKTIASKEAPTGPGKGERLGESVGGLVGGFAGSAMPIVGNVAVGAAAAGAGKAVGRGVDRLRGRRAQPMVGQLAPKHEPVNEGQHIPTERVMSPAAAGQQNEVL